MTTSRTSPDRAPTVPDRHDHGWAAPRAAPGRAVPIASVASVLAGLMHYVAAAAHLPGQPMAGVLFVGLGAFQIVWPSVPADGRRWTAVAAVVVNTAALGAWALTRTVALPFGHHARSVQDVGWFDLGTVILEVVVVVATATLLLRGAGPLPDRAGQ